MFNLHTSFLAVIAENRQHAHQETHLPTTKIVTILIPSFHGLRYGTRGLQSREDRRKKKRLHILGVLKQARLTNNSMICSDIWHKYHSWYFKIVSNFTRPTAREITYNNFEISLVVFMPNITTNHAITYTYGLKSSLRNMEMWGNIQASITTHRFYSKSILL